VSFLLFIGSTENLVENQAYLKVKS